MNESYSCNRGGIEGGFLTNSSGLKMEEAAAEDGALTLRTRQAECKSTVIANNAFDSSRDVHDALQKEMVVINPQRAIICVHVLSAMLSPIQNFCTVCMTYH